MLDVATPNFLTPTSFKSPPYGKGNLLYQVKTFADYDDEALLDSDITAFFDSLIVPDAPWPHIVSMTTNVINVGSNAMITTQFLYILVSPA